MRAYIGLVLVLTMATTGAALAQQPAAQGSCSGAQQKCVSGCPEGAKGNRCPMMCQQAAQNCMQTGDWISPFSNSTVVAHNLRRE
jgi:hypothetical protein